MTKKIEEIYLNIAQAIVDSIDVEWTEAKINTAYFDDAAEFDCTYKVAGESKEFDFDVAYATYLNFKELHYITTSDASNRWNRALFYLKPDGEFSIDFIWDAELADEIEKFRD